MSGRSGVQVVAVTGGKGGVGKTNVSVNLAVAAALQGQRTLLLDADLGLGNVGVLLGLQLGHDLADLLAGNCELGDLLLDGPGGLRIVPAASGVQRMTALSAGEHAGLIGAFEQLGEDLDLLLVDTAAGISDGVVTFCQAAREVIVVTCDEPAARTDAYALMKVLSQDHGIRRFHLVANMVTDYRQGRNLFARLTAVADRFLDLQLNYLGAIPADPQLRIAVQRQQAVVASAPRSRSAAAFRALAQTLGGWPRPSMASGRMEFFLERLLRPSLGATV